MVFPQIRTELIETKREWIGITKPVIGGSTLNDYEVVEIY